MTQVSWLPNISIAPSIRVKILGLRDSLPRKKPNFFSRAKTKENKDQIVYDALVKHFCGGKGTRRSKQEKTSRFWVACQIASFGGNKAALVLFNKNLIFINDEKKNFSSANKTR